MKNFIRVFIALMLVSVPASFAQETNTTSYEVYGIKEYSLFDRAMDRIKLRFTLQEERKQEALNNIELRREQHYQFLLSKGKISQAGAFKEKTDKLGYSFERWKENKQRVLSRLEDKMNASRTRIEEIKIGIRRNMTTEK